MTEGAGSSPSPVVPLRASWRGPRSTTVLLFRPLPLRVETGSGHVLLFSGGPPLPPARPAAPCPHPPAQLSFGRARPPGPRGVAPLPRFQPETLLPPSGRTKEDTAPTRGNQFRDSNYHKK